ncbi:MAG: hypothetical protein A3E07_01155 [Candidatus Wildermuthbacteria bacterium RIFCSPHIGHO2_12_FULL_45_9]|uniref:Uncharacterized protein n=1 Tax=Candidatus Wildermuthbacteria bacterium RIFCSPHIGHO2_02_FULL_45_25 TaxID=1802450 RepID=A0A1G2R1G6_9BACT|nr:MAG: hypothetical protein A2748_00695 [Candidatus Wildermuthbacteria bacterium RIFCSPHIGHO2_01_FULL_45_20]OHA66725.1 MAG: hypothetical protein A3C04_00240 [Candidatus Wildermuthbacteria bacterium RIFCSPHIGHO2_02_FULL_45_25]OHA71479.1 MAG: hypothetical protein A3E07_01155 [Candidatus Wildermuthbacteria bacterium RIFCSPHIGHO2_12_FULL_45_9]
MADQHNRPQDTSLFPLRPDRSHYTLENITESGETRLALLQQRLQTIEILPEEISFLIEEFRKRLQVALGSIRWMRIEKSHLPLLPVIPHTILSIRKQMQMVRRFQNSGEDLTNNKLEDLIHQAPDHCYWVVDINRGHSLPASTWIEEIALELMKNRQQALTGIEIVSFAIHTDTLDLGRYGLCAAASRYCQTNEYPVIMCHHESPRLVAAKRVPPLCRYIVPTCAWRITT